MRMSLFLVGLLLCLTLPLRAEETPEATAKRVRELEKANVVLQEDLGRTQITVDTLNTTLKKTLKNLDDEIAARKALEANLQQEIAARTALADALKTLQKTLTEDLVKQIADLKTAMATDNAAQNEKIAALEKALNAQIAKHDADMAALKDTTDKQIAALKDTLDKERADRLAAEAALDKARAKLAKDNKKSHTIMGIMGVILGGLAVAK